MNLPPDFLDKMQRLLGSEYEAFVGSLERPLHHALRFNTLKTDPTNHTLPFTLTPVGDWEPAGFHLHDADRPGNHPAHAAGLYYLQEPSAMTVSALADPQPGELVLDLAAAPGGKSTHLAARMGDTGMLVANDIDRQRVQHLAQNMERWGARQVLITNVTPPQLAGQFGPIFDRVLLDAPCSGEGMLRRTGGHEWDEGLVAACARRQQSILDTAVSLVRTGGRLIYSTCTFSPEENEAVIGRFLQDHPRFDVETPLAIPGARPGRPDWANGDPRLAQTVRFWPHHFPGEGHFVAVLRCRKTAETAATPSPFQPKRGDWRDFRHWRDFARTVLSVDWDEKRLHEANGRLYLLPENAIDTGSLYLVRYGVLLGELRRGYFRPSHHLALALRPQEVQDQLALTDDEAFNYLRGETWSVSGQTNGWRLLTINGAGLGWGKVVNGRLQNHYPRGLRLF
jgi:16S rRNA C967 or C1407 C5-methylase (RsmB/RsmF family)/NOL1/NOP2/fmu family ribosome biogenesis protein